MMQCDVSNDATITLGHPGHGFITGGDKHGGIGGQRLRIAVRAMNVRHQPNAGSRISAVLSSDAHPAEGTAVGQLPPVHCGPVQRWCCHSVLVVVELIVE